MKILFLRHPKTDESKVAGWTDEPLLQDGPEQARRLLSMFQEQILDLDVRSVITSDLVRARQTAEVVAKQLHATLTVDKSWRSFHIGASAGLTHEAFLKAHPGKHYKTMGLDEALDDGETPRAFFHRIAGAFHELMHHLPTEGDMIVITHRSVLEVVQAIVRKEVWSNQKNYPLMMFLVVEAQPSKSKN